MGADSDAGDIRGRPPRQRPLPVSSPQGETQPLRLTRREAEVLQAIADGLRTREIAEFLAIGEPTVRTYMARLLARLSAKTRAQAVAIGFQNRLIR